MRQVWEADRAARKSRAIREDSPQVESQITASVLAEMKALSALAQRVSLVMRSCA